MDYLQSAPDDDADWERMNRAADTIITQQVVQFRVVEKEVELKSALVLFNEGHYLEVVLCDWEFSNEEDEMVKAFERESRVIFFP